MKKIFLALFILINCSVFAQVAITPEIVTTLRNEAEKWVQTYNNNLNNLGSPYINPMEKTMLIENTLKQFEDENVVVLNDLDLSGKTTKEQKVRQHLGNIVTWFARDGVSFKFQNIKVSNVFVDKKTGNYFLKVEVERQIQGNNVNGVAISGNLNLDFYIKYLVSEGQISAKPLIFSITERMDNLSSFTPAEVKEKADQSVSLSKDTKEMEEITKAAAEQEAELKKKQEEADKATFKADSVQGEATKMKKKYMNERYGLRLSPRIYPLRLMEGVLQFGIAKNIISTRKFEMAAALSYGMQFKAASRFITFSDSVRNDTLYDKMHFWNNAEGYVIRGEIHFHFKQNKWFFGYMFNMDNQKRDNTFYPAAGTELKYKVHRNATGNHFMIGAHSGAYELYFAIGLKNVAYKTENIPIGMTQPQEIKKSTPSILLGMARKFNF